MKLIQKNLSKNQYHNDIQPKRIVVLHHTAGSSALSSINWWEQTAERVATSVVVDRDGTIYQAFPFDRWASHLGIKQTVFNKFGVPNINTRLDQISIGIEIANWGELTKKGDKFYTYTNSEIDKKNVQEYPQGFRGSKYYEKYTPEQIESVKELLILFNQQFGIKLDYYPSMWETNSEALRGFWGIWTHVSFRPDKNDCHPQPDMISMLKSLK